MFDTHDASRINAWIAHAKTTHTARIQCIRFISHLFFVVIKKEEPRPRHTPSSRYPGCGRREVIDRDMHRRADSDTATLVELLLCRERGETHMGTQQQLDARVQRAFVNHNLAHSHSHTNTHTQRSTSPPQQRYHEQQHKRSGLVPLHLLRGSDTLRSTMCMSQSCDGRYMATAHGDHTGTSLSLSHTHTHTLSLSLPSPPSLSPDPLHTQTQAQTQAQTLTPSLPFHTQSR